MSPERALLTLGVLAFAGVVYALMWLGWRRRAQRQSDLPVPPVPPAATAPPLAGPTPGLFVGTTLAGQWLQRVVVHHLSHRGTGTLTVRPDGVLVSREGEQDLFLPRESVVRADVGSALAGKVMGANGLVLVTWRLGDELLDSGFRADDHRDHRALADAVNGLVSKEIA